jgi:hypothetical protein
VCAVSQYADVPAEAEQDEAADRQRDEDECGDDDQNYCCADQAEPAPAEMTLSDFAT